MAFAEDQMLDDPAPHRVLGETKVGFDRDDLGEELLRIKFL